MNDIRDVRFFEGGKAVFTVSNDKGEHYTYRINHPTSKPYFVSLLRGPDNMTCFTYMGLYIPQTHEVRLTAKSRFSSDARAVKVLQWAIKQVLTGATLPAGYAIQHENACACCGRRLTTPESIERGIGPECIKRFSLAA